MPPRNIALVAGAVVVLGAWLLLLVEVNAGSEADIPDDLLAEARERYARRQAGRSVRPPPVAPSTATRPPPPPREPPRSRDEEPEEPAPPSPDHDATQERLLALRKARARASEPDEATKAALNVDRRKIGTLYDQGNHEEALEAAKAFLEDKPEERYIRRVAVTSACALGDESTARSYFEKMHPTDRTIVTTRCARFGVDL